MKRVYFKWLWSFIIIFSIPMLCSLIMAFELLMEWKSDLISLESNSAKMIQIQADAVMTRVRAAAEKLAESEDVVAFCRETDETRKKMLSTEAYDRISAAKNGEEVIDDIFLLSQDNRAVLSVRYASNAQKLSLFDYEKEFGESEDQFWERFSQVRNSNLVFGSSEGEACLYYLFPIITDSIRDPGGYILVRYHLLESSMLLTDDQFVYLDAGEDCLLDPYNEKYLSPEESARLRETESGTTYTHRNKAFFIIKGYSNNSGYVYSFGIRVRTLFQAVLRMVLLLLSESIIVLAVCLVLALYFSKKHVDPLTQLVARLRRENALEEAQPKDVVRELENGFTLLMNQKKSLEKRMEDEKDVVMNYSLIRLLKGYYRSEEEIGNIFSQYGVKFDRPYYALALWSVEDYSSLVDDDHSQTDSADLALFLIHNIGLEYLNEMDISCNVIYSDFMVAFLINYDRNCSSDYFLERLTEILKKTEIYLDEKCSIKAEWFMSREYRALAEVKYAFMDCLTKMNEWSHFDVDTAYRKPQLDEQLNKLFILVENRKNSASRMFSEIMKRQRDWENDWEKRLFIYGLLQEFTELFRKDSDSRNLARIGELMNTEDTALLSISVEKWLNHLEEEENTGLGLTEKMVDYIDDHIFDPELSLAFVADYFHVSESYVSKLMKKEFEMGSLQYITNRRVERIKFLLDNTSLSIGEISQKVGYYSYRTMVRVFRQAEGISPREYRRNQES